MAKDNSFHVLVIGAGESAELPCISQMKYCQQEELTQVAGITGLLIAQGPKKA